MKAKDKPLSEYEIQMQKANPRYAITTHDGYILTPEESAFIYYYIILNDTVLAFKNANMPVPNVPITADQRWAAAKRCGIDQVSNNTVDRKENKCYIDIYTGEQIEDIKIPGAAEGVEEGEDKDSITYKKQLDKYNKDKEAYEKMTKEEKEVFVRLSATNVLRRRHVISEIQYRTQAVQNALVARPSEVLAYFTAVMRGEVRDQFGLEASLQERTRAAECLAKRIIDLPKATGDKDNGSNNGGVNIIIQPRKEIVIGADCQEVI